MWERAADEEKPGGREDTYHIQGFAAECAVHVNHFTVGQRLEHGHELSAGGADVAKLGFHVRRAEGTRHCLPACPCADLIELL